MNRTFTIATGLALVLGIGGCGATSNNASTPSATNNMGNMTMGNQTSSTAATQSSSGLAQAFQDELNGFTAIENDIQKNDYKDATPLADNLHNEFHAVILPPLKAKKGSAYAEDIHGKYDELQDAIKEHDSEKINQLVKVNRNNLYTVAGILGVNLPK